MSWKVKAWSWELRTGVVTSANNGDFPFEGSASTADDLEVGEAVHVDFALVDETYRVRRVRPVSPRVPGFSYYGGYEPQKTRDAVEGIRAVLATVPIGLECRVSAFDPLGRVVELELADGFGHPWYPVQCKLEFSGVEYLELVCDLALAQLECGNPRDRAYIASRMDLSDPSLVVIKLSDGVRPHFIVCAALRLTNLP